MNKHKLEEREYMFYGFFLMFDRHWTTVSKNLAKLGHNSDTSALYKALGCKADIIAVSMQIGT